MLQLVGNKSDLERQVSQEEVSLFCAAKQLSYAETSSTDTQLTHQLFHRLGEEIIRKGYLRGVPGSAPQGGSVLTLSKQQPRARPSAPCCASGRDTASQ